MVAVELKRPVDHCAVPERQQLALRDTQRCLESKSAFGAGAVNSPSPSSAIDPKLIRYSLLRWRPPRRLTVIQS
jgi:hypothetical protein